MATGRSDYPNQVNNVLAFPGIFRGALSTSATTINEEMNLAAARAIAAVITEDELHEEYVIPSVFNKAVVESVARRSPRRRSRPASPSGGVGGCRVGRIDLPLSRFSAAPQRRTLAQERLDSLLRVAQGRVLRHHRLGEIVGRRLGQVDLVVERPLAEPDRDAAGG